MKRITFSKNKFPITTEPACLCNRNPIIRLWEKAEVINDTCPSCLGDFRTGNEIVTLYGVELKTTNNQEIAGKSYTLHLSCLTKITIKSGCYFCRLYINSLLRIQQDPCINLYKPVLTFKTVQ